MKKLHVLLLVLLIAGCSSNREISPPARTEIPGTITPSSTIEATLTPTSIQTPQPSPSLIPSFTPTPTNFTLSTKNINEISMLNQWGKGTLKETAWSPDGKLFVAGTALGVYIFDVKTMNEIRFIKTEESVGVLAISPDGKTLATSSDRIDLWDIETGKHIATLAGTYKGYISYFSFSPNGSYIGAMGTEGGGGDPPASFRLWRLSDRRLVYSEEISYCGYGSSFAFSPDSRMIAFQVCGNLSLKQIPGGQQVIEFPMNVNSLNVVFTKDGKSLLTSTTDDAISIIDIKSQKISKEFNIASGFNEVIISPDGKIVALLDVWDDGRQLWITDILDVETGERQFIIDGDHYGLSFSTEGNQLSAINEQGDLEFWNVETGDLVKTVSWTKIFDCVDFGLYRPDNGASISLLIAGNKTGQIVLINSDTGETIQTIKISELPITAITIHPNGYMVGVGSFDNEADNESSHIIIYDLRTNQTINEITIKRQLYPVNITGLAFSLDSSSIAAKVGTFHDIQAWDIYTGESITDPSGKTWYNAVEIDADMRGHLVDLEFDQTTTTLEILDTYSRETLASSLSIDGIGLCQENEDYSMSYDGRFFALGCDLSTLPVWDMKNQSMAYNFDEHKPSGGDGFSANITDVSFSPYNYLLASSGYDDTIRFWDIGAGKLLLTLDDHSCTVLDVAFSIDGSFFASTSCDGTLRLWGLPR